jgi:hypothetical protein
VWPHFNLWTTAAFYVIFQPLNHCSMLCNFISTSDPLQLAVWPFNLWTTTAFCVTFQPLEHYSMLCSLLSTSEPLQHGVTSFQPLNHYSLLWHLSTSKPLHHAVWAINLWTTIACCVILQPLNHYSLLSDLASSEPLLLGIHNWTRPVNLGIRDSLLV